MPPILYGAPWQMGDEQPQAYMDAGFEPLSSNTDDTEPYMFVGGRKLLKGDQLLVACDGRSPLKLEVVGTDPYNGYIRVSFPAVRSDGFFSPALVLSPGTLVKRADDAEVDEELKGD